MGDGEGPGAAAGGGGGGGGGEVHVLTAFGVGRLEGESGSGQCRVALPWGVATLQADSVQTTVPVSVKPFMGTERGVFEVRANLNASVKSLKATIAEKLGRKAAEVRMCLVGYRVEALEDDTPLHATAVRAGSRLVVFGRQRACGAEGGGGGGSGC